MKPDLLGVVQFKFVLALLCMFAFLVQAKEPVLEQLTIQTASGNNIVYQIEVARTPSQMQRGLMFRDTLPEDRGMLFIYKPERRARMWMKNTILPLDMLFIDAKGEIINIARNTTPYSLDTIDAGGEVRGVLELNAGQADKHGIVIGDTVKHTVFAEE